MKSDQPTTIPPSLEYVNCVFCGSSQSRLIYNFEPLAIVKCAGCGLVYTNPRLSKEERDKIYNKEYFPELKIIDIHETPSEDSPVFKLYVDRRLKEILKHNTRGRNILDIGCGTGYFLKMAKEAGWNAFGIETSDFAVNYARNKLGLNIYKGYITESDLPKNYFDVITINHVLEHVVDPISFLKSAYELLKEDGLLVVAVPNIESGSARKMGEEWPALIPHIHLYHFSKEVLSREIKKSGFEVTEIKLTAGTYLMDQTGLLALKFKKIFVRYIQYLQWARSITHFIMIRSLRLDNSITIYAKKRLNNSPRRLEDENSAKVTISIIAHGYRHFLECCLDSLRKAAVKTPIEVFVINNCVRFNIKQVIDIYYPQVKIIENDKILGFAANHNQVLQNCNAKYVLVLNDDIQLAQGCIDFMYDFMEKNHRAGIVGPQLFEKRWNTNPVSSGGSIYFTCLTPLKMCLARLGKEFGLESFMKKFIGHRKDSGLSFTPLSFVSGACCVIRRRTLDQIGLFDENFYLYLEDVDLGLRTRTKGWGCYQVGAARALHYSGASGTSQTKNWQYNSIAYYAKKHCGFIVKLITYSFILFLKSLDKVKAAIFNIIKPQGKSILLDNLNINKILILKLGGVGDIITIMPSLKAIRDKYPKAYIALMAEAGSYEIIKNSGYVNEFIDFTSLYRIKNVRDGFNFKILKQILLMAKMLRRQKFDLFIEFQIVRIYRTLLKPIFLSLLSGAKARVGLDTDGKSMFLNIRVPDKFINYNCATDTYLKVAKALGADITDRKPHILISDEDLSWAKDLLRKYNIDIDTAIIGIHTGSKRLDRTAWPRERFLQLIDRLADEYRAQIIITGTQDEVAYVEEIVSLLDNKKNIISLAGLTNLQQLSAIIKNCGLFISSDTGPMHIAINLGIPTVGILGPGDYTITAYEVDNFVPLRKFIDCWPCRDLNCTTKDCLKLVDVGDVLRAVRYLNEKYKILKVIGK
ncbi:MAG: methyltransferase domain-containing protein [Candidatus Omnitrophota bacterium]|nr:methyltransferase domain-containing protein [Candidatus Omnitrophota bacterium]